jgi:hypothetical protein
MWIGCECGNTIKDNTDYLPFKARFIADGDWFAMLNMVRDAIENARRPGAPTEQDVTASLLRFSTSAWQCTQCARIYFDRPGNALHCFSFEKSLPEDEAAAKNLFHAQQGVRG